MKKDSKLHNEYAPDTKVRLDKGFRNSSIVTVVNQAPQKLFTTVTINGIDKWDVMTNKLSPLIED